MASKAASIPIACTLKSVVKELAHEVDQHPASSTQPFTKKSLWLCICNIQIRGFPLPKNCLELIELVKPGSDEPNSEAQAAIIKYCVSKGVLILSAGTYANVIRLLPSLAIDEALLIDGLAVLDEAIASIKN